MKLKNPLSYGTWAFYIGENDEIRVPAEGYLKTRQAMVNAVHQTLLTMAAQGRKEFLDTVEQEAKKVNVPVMAFLQNLVEHQICVRSPSKELCRSSSIGDKLHSLVAALDSTILGEEENSEQGEDGPKVRSSIVAKAYRSIAKTVTKKISGEEKPRLSSCRTCGGTRSLSGKMFNLGRAGRMGRHG